MHTWTGHANLLIEFSFQEVRLFIVFEGLRVILQAVILFPSSECNLI
jgi:hypothetical protein